MKSLVHSVKFQRWVTKKMHLLLLSQAQVVWKLLAVNSAKALIAKAV
jgi:hypothetical protein